ncbi:Prolyl 4-hydroxylase subunit alpha-3 [Dissostichus eleginoides]|uniref:Prolyl 4-hydroxylase subunit alpha-3 n=1 Tax=Dissostichus eleginoides TaxID=100907 RepID=A0AAD9CDW4_DISEL|nr:Prolyl 4-hydroxylase subunit alpha-3 [Dissostichus eleginoides]
MLRIFATNRHFLDNSRYILFAYMLINDTLQLLSSVILFLLVIGLVTFPTVYCVPLLLLSTFTFMNTTLILATMSLERYVAIIYPLQCPAAWRSDRIWIIILSIWFLSFIFPMIEYSIGERDPAVDILSTPVLCKPIYINSSPIQALFEAAVNILFFAVVSVVILFTYIQILLKTRKMRQDKVASLIRGLFQRVTEGQPIDIYRPAVSVPLSGDDCFLVGKVAYEQQDYYHSVQWLEESVRLFRGAGGEWIPENASTLEDALDHLAFSHFKVWMELGN